MSLHISVSKDEFLAGLTSIQNIASKKGSIAILSNVLIQTENDSLILTGTDLEVGIKTTLPAEITAPGSITLPAKKLFEIVRESNNEHIKLEELENNWVRIKAKATNYNLSGMPAEEFPSFPEYDDEKLTLVNSEIMRDLIDKTIFSVASEAESQFNLTGVLLEKINNDENKKILRMVSSDGHRLSLMEKEISDEEYDNLTIEKNTIIPKKGIQEIRKWCEAEESINIYFDKKQAVIKTSNSILIIRLMNGDFPDYRNIVSAITNENYFLIDKNEFLNSMKRMNIFTEDRFNAVHFNIDKHKLILTSESLDIGNATDEIDIELHGIPMKLGFNGKYFIDTLHAMQGNKINVNINSQESPCLLTSQEDKGFESIIMPMKI